jgi:hypothetical protein
MDLPRGQRILKRRPWLPGVAIGGVWAAHVLAYAIASPDADQRQELLGSTGHGYWSVVWPLAVSVLIAAVAGFIVEQVRRPSTSRTVTYGSLVAQLVLLQMVTFLGVEATERLVQDASLAGIFQPVVGIGVVLQVVGACVAALLLFALGRAVNLVIGRRLVLPRVRVITPLAPATVAVRRFVLASGGPTLRGPPTRV